MRLSLPILQLVLGSVNINLLAYFQQSVLLNGVAHLICGIIYTCYLKELVK